jgi:hypothetical protein
MAGIYDIMGYVVVLFRYPLWWREGATLARRILNICSRKRIIIAVTVLAAVGAIIEIQRRASREVYSAVDSWGSVDTLIEDFSFIKKAPSPECMYYDPLWFPHRHNFPITWDI